MKKEVRLNSIKSCGKHWHEIKKTFGFGQRGVISLVGAGGKTTLMFRIAEMIACCGQSVLTTTTTKIYIPIQRQRQDMVVANNVDLFLNEVRIRLKHTFHITAGAEQLNSIRKIKGFEPQMISEIWRSNIFDWIIVEADGCAGRPLKAPAAHEPVIPEVTHFLIAVTSLLALGKPLDERWVHRPERYSAVTGMDLGDLITPASVADVLTCNDGVMKGAPLDSRRIIFLNTVGHKQLQKAGKAIAVLVQKKDLQRQIRILVGAAEDPPTQWYQIPAIA